MTRFFDQVQIYFGDIFDEYGFAPVEEAQPAGPRGSAIVPLESDVYGLRVLYDPRGDEITMEAGPLGGRRYDMALLYEFLMRGQTDAEFYHYPTRTRGLYGVESILWQLERLAGLLRPLWPRIFAALDAGTPAHATFQEYLAERAGARQQGRD